MVADDVFVGSGVAANTSDPRPNFFGGFLRGDTPVFDSYFEGHGSTINHTIEGSVIGSQFSQWIISVELLSKCLDETRVSLRGLSGEGKGGERTAFPAEDQLIFCGRS